MSFLDTLRQGTDSTATRVLLGLVAVAFIVGIGGRNRNSRSEIYAVVDGQAITKSEFDQTMRMAARQSGKNLSDSERNALAGDVLEMLIVQEVLLQQASDLNIGVSDGEIARMLKAQPNFQKDGKFDQQTYEHELRDRGYSADRFEELQRRDMLLQKVQEIAQAGVTVTEAEVQTADP